MGRQKREFTAAEQAALKKNPYTYRVHKTSISFTAAFKETFMQQYEAGMSSTKIVEKMGYDAQALGSRRINSLYRNFQQQRISSEGLHEGTSRSGRYRPGSTDFESAPTKHVLQLMQHELLYLRQEVEFLKKIMNADKQSREGRR